MSQNRHSLVVALVLSACQATSERAQTPPDMRVPQVASAPKTSKESMSPPVDADARSPITSTWTERERGPTSTVIVARVERLAGLAFPLTATVKAPKGVEVVGPSTFTLAAGEAPGFVEQVVTLRYDALPSADVVLVVDGAAKDFGYHAEVPYAFGRAAQVPASPNADGANVKIGGRELGPAVNMTP